MLYVGVSLSVLSRLAKHRDRSAWFKEIARITVENFPDRNAALAAEDKAIRDEWPEFNKRGRPISAKKVCFSVIIVEVGTGYTDGWYCIGNEESGCYTISDVKSIVKYYDRVRPGYKHVIRPEGGKYAGRCAGELSKFALAAAIELRRNGEHPDQQGHRSQFVEQAEFVPA